MMSAFAAQARTVKWQTLSPGVYHMGKIAAVCLAILFSGHQLDAQLPPDSLFPRLIGGWVPRGTIARQATTHDVTFEWMLGHEYVQMHEVSRDRSADGSPLYEAIVLFGRDPLTGEYGCLWLDNTGASAFNPAGVGHGSVSGESIPFLFRYTATERFHTTFVYSGAADAWQWHMDNDSAGMRRPFARVTLTRQQCDGGTNYLPPDTRLERSTAPGYPRDATTC